MKVKEVKTPETLTLEELMNLVNDLHALMWYGDGCEICAHCEVIQKEPYPAICSIKHRLNALPAGDVVEVRHGEWKKVHDEVCYWLACSVCGEEIPKRFGTDYYTNYCPNCGAKMDGGADDE